MLVELKQDTVTSPVVLAAIHLHHSVQGDGWRLLERLQTSQRADPVIVARWRLIGGCGQLKTEEKRRKMTDSQVAAYNAAAIERSGLVRPRGRLQLLDLHTLTAGCGDACTGDGIHYNNATYDTALQQLLQVLVRRPTSSLPQWETLYPSPRMFANPNRA